MSIFAGSERFPNEAGMFAGRYDGMKRGLVAQWCGCHAARSPGPVYGRPEVRAKASVVMKADYQPVDESRKWGKRESWIGGSYSPHMPVVPKGAVDVEARSTAPYLLTPLLLCRSCRKQPGTWALQRQRRGDQEASTQGLVPQV